MPEFIYMDHAATTPLDPLVAARMETVRQPGFANPASNHIAGRLAARLVDQAAAQLGTLLNVETSRLVWTSGATESNNLAIIGAARHREHRGRHLVTMRSEHKAVVDVFRALEKQGFEVTWLSGDAEGTLSPASLIDAVRDDTQLVSIMHVNNEVGTLQDIAALGSICRQRGITFHVDGAQAVGKIAVDLDALPVDLYSITAHKFNGPKGVGALFVAEGTIVEPQIFGGGQQRRLRPGTLPVELIVGLGAAAELATDRVAEDQPKLAQLRSQLLSSLLDIDGVYLNGPRRGGSAGILNVGVDDVEGESLLLALEPLCVSSGSACNALSKEPSYVLRSLGRSDAEAQSAVRFSLGRSNTVSDVEFAAAHYRGAVEKLRALSPDRNKPQ